MSDKDQGTKQISTEEPKSARGADQPRPHLTLVTPVPREKVPEHLFCVPK